MPRLVLRTRRLNGPWTPLTTDLRRGVRVEDFQCSADEAGPFDCTFNLKRSSRVPWPDISFWAPIEAELDNQLLWSGRVLQAPGSTAEGDTVQVTGQGWQGHTDDLPYTKMFVHSALGDFADVRGLPSAQLGPGAGFHPASCQVSTDAGGITLMFPANLPIGQFEGCSVQLDLGPDNTATRVVVDVTTSNNDASSGLFGFIGNDPRPQQGSSGGTVSQSVNVASATLAGATTANRYVSFRLQRQGVAYAPPADVWVKITRILVFSTSAYESGNASILKSSDIVLDALARLVQIDQGTGLITASSFSLPNFSVDEQTPREAIAAANAFQDYQFRIRADLKAEYRPRPTSPTVMLSDRAAFQDLSAGSGESLYSQVTYVGTGPDGTPVRVTRTSSDAGLPDTLVTRRGGDKGYTIESSATLTAAAATQLCDVFLQQRNLTPFKGTINATSRKSVSLLPSGANCPPAHLLRVPGELCSFRHLIDPDTGALGRNGRIRKVTYTHATDSATADIDSTPGSYEALQQRLAVTTAR